MSFLDKLMHAADMHQKGDPALADDHSVYASPGDPEQQFNANNNPGQAQIAYEQSKSPEEIETRQIPYRGNEQHGVANIGDGRYDWHHSTSGHVLDDTATVPVEWHAEEEEHPIAVRVVDTAPSNTERRLVAFSTNILIGGDAQNQMVRVLMERHNRTKAEIKIMTAAPAFTAVSRAWLSPKQLSMPLPANGVPNGFPLDASSNSYSTNTTEELWVGFDAAAANGALAIICVAEEYIVEVPANGVKPEKPHLLGR